MIIITFSNKEKFAEISIFLPAKTMNPSNKRKSILSEKISNNYSNLVKQQKSNTIKLDKGFYEKSCTDLATSLLGKILIRKINETIILKGRIVETECYPGNDDQASHSYNGR